MTVPCSTLLLLAGTWGSCLTFRVEEESAVDEENVGREWGCTLVEDREWEREKKGREKLLLMILSSTKAIPPTNVDQNVSLINTQHQEVHIFTNRLSNLHDRVILLICIIAKSYKEIRTSTRAEGVKPMKKIAVNCERRHCCYDAYGNKQKTGGRWWGQVGFQYKKQQPHKTFERIEQKQQRL